MPNDQPTPRPPLSPPFSRPTHPGYLPAIQPDSDAGRPLRPTPYANAVILPPIAGQAGLGTEAGMPSSAGPDAERAGESERRRAAGEASEYVDRSPTGEDRGEGVSSTPAAAAAVPSADATSTAQPAAGQGAAEGVLRSLRDIPVDHGHPTGVPANPEPAVEGVGAVWDYPTDSVWSSDAVFGWGASAADWELVNASTVHTPSRPLPEVVSSQLPVRADSAPSDLALGAAELLEELARAIRRGEVVLPAVPWPQTAPAVLAAVLTALLARTGTDQWEAREASASEQRR